MPIVDDIRTDRAQPTATVAIDRLGGDPVDFTHLHGLVLDGPDASAPSRASLVVQAAAKRAADVVVAGTVLLLSLPLIAVVSLLILLDSRGPVFYRAARVGRGGRELRMLKFRKMHHDASGAPLTMSQDARFTRIGALLARTKIDELPQLWHVLRGHMSLIGPRPEDPAFVAERAAEYRQILAVRPGITGLSQIAFAEESEILDKVDPMSHYRSAIFPQKIALDRLYASRPTLRMDVAILFWTLAAVLLRRQVAVHRESGRMNLRRR
jgi:lipopolysaccharide/colanic/teichoic acid biosynthesis glycosyltransferase